MHTWQMQEAKARMAEMVKRAQSEGPQDITLHGKSVAVVVARETYDQLSRNQQSLTEFMRQSPLYGMEDISFDRDLSPARDVSL